MCLSGCPDGFLSHSPAFIVVSHDPDFARLIFHVRPDEAVSSHQCPVVRKNALPFADRRGILPDDALADPVDEELGGRPGCIDHHRHIPAFLSLPVPVRKHVQSGLLPVPDAPVEVESVLRDGCQVNDAEHGGVARPGLGVVRSRLAEIVEAGPYELSGHPGVCLVGGEVHIRDVGPPAILIVIGR